MKYLRTYHRTPSSTNLHTVPEFSMNFPSWGPPHCPEYLIGSRRFSHWCPLHMGIHTSQENTMMSFLFGKLMSSIVVHIIQRISQEVSLRPPHNPEDIPVEVQRFPMDFSSQESAHKFQRTSWKVPDLSWGSSSQKSLHSPEFIGSPIRMYVMWSSQYMIVPQIFCYTTHKGTEDCLPMNNNNYYITSRCYLPAIVINISREETWASRTSLTGCQLQGIPQHTCTLILCCHFWLQFNLYTSGRLLNSLSPA